MNGIFEKLVNLIQQTIFVNGKRVRFVQDNELGFLEGVCDTVHFFNEGILGRPYLIVLAFYTLEEFYWTDSKEKNRKQDRTLNGRIWLANMTQCPWNHFKTTMNALNYVGGDNGKIKLYCGAANPNILKKDKFLQKLYGKMLKQKKYGSLITLFALIYF